MRKTAIALTVLVAALSSPVIASDGSPEWKQNFTMFVSRAAPHDVVEVIASVEASGGHVGIVVTPRVYLGWLPADMRWQSFAGVSQVIWTAEQAVNIEVHLTEQERAGVRYFTDVVSGKRPIQGSGRPLAFPMPDVLNHAVDNREDPLDFSASSIPYCRWANCVMSGLTAAAVIFVESNGTVDPDTYSWTVANLESTRTAVLDGAAFWANQAAARGLSLTFTFEWYPPVTTSFATGRTEVFQPYEPILHPGYYDYGLWVNSVMANFGYTSGATLDRVKMFNNALRYRTGAQRYFTTFVAYNPVGAPDRFTDGLAAFVPALGGPMVQMLFRNYSHMSGDVFAHETGHIFWACDEYLGSNCSCSSACYTSENGPRPDALNGNCHTCSSASCMMKDISHVVCTHTSQHIGWGGL